MSIYIYIGFWGHDHIYIEGFRVKRTYNNSANPIRTPEFGFSNRHIFYRQHGARARDTQWTPSRCVSSTTIMQRSDTASGAKGFSTLLITCLRNLDSSNVQAAPVQRTADVRTAAARGGYKGLTSPLNLNVIGIMTYSEQSIITSRDPHDPITLYGMRRACSYNVLWAAGRTAHQCGHINTVTRVLG